MPCPSMKNRTGPTTVWRLYCPLNRAVYGLLLLYACDTQEFVEALRMIAKKKKKWRLESIMPLTKI